MEKKLKNQKYLEWALVGLVFVLMLAWAFTSTLPGGPDEGMRYNVAKYLYKNPGKLPHGADAAIRNSRWGISYGFYPILSYMVSAVFMWIAGIFSTSKEVLLHAARLADVLFMTIAADLVIRIGRRLFDGEKKWFFSVLVIFLPGYLFMGTYVNTDSLALMAVTMILLSWVKYLDEGWTWKNCVLLASGMGICFLSYYNAYGWILWSFFFFCVTVLLCSQESMKERWKFLFSRGFVIAGITFLLAGWWFIRNYFIYDGDILARNASTICAEKYAQKEFKPSVHVTPAKLGWCWKQFFLYQDPGWTHNWMVMVLVSFVGTFGSFTIYMNETVSKVYIIFLGLGFLGIFMMLKEFYWKKHTVTLARTTVRNQDVAVKTVHTYKEWDKKGVFNLAMLAAMITPVVLFINYAYYNDNQAQGRYIMSAVFPVMYFVTCGYDKLLNRFVKNEVAQKWFYRVASGVWIVGAVLTYLVLIVPAYIK